MPTEDSSMQRQVTIDFRDIERAPGAHRDPIAAQAFPVYSGLVSVTYWGNPVDTYQVEPGPFREMFASVLEDMSVKLTDMYVEHAPSGPADMDREEWQNHLFEVFDERMLKSAMEIAWTEEPEEIAWVKITLHVGDPSVFEVLSVGRWEPRQVSYHEA